MLFRKPFAFLIKYFKVIHFTLTIMIAYLLLRTNRIFRFVGEYMSSNLSTIGTNITSTLFSPVMLLIIIGVLILTFIILGLMSFKKKPIRFYVFNILVYSFVTFVFIFCYTNIKTLEIGLLSVRTLKIMQDLCLFALIMQSLSLIVVAMRATGFNIKKFDFDQDLEDLKIASEDNEEFEIDVELDTDQLKRNIRKKLRHAKYVYIENKFMIHMIALLVLAAICFIVYLNVGVYHKIYKQNEAFTTTEFIINIENSYITSKNYHNEEIKKDKKFLVIQYQIRSNYQVNKKVFNPSRFTLMIGNTSFHASSDYKEEMYDLGNIYHNEYMTTTFEPYILVYELPEYLNTEKIILKYQDTNDKVIETSITPIDDSTKTTTSYLLDGEISLTQSILKKSKIKIDSYEIGDTFINNYIYCITDNNCLTGVEYIKPSMSDNYDKTLMKLVGNFTLDENSYIHKLADLYTVMRDFGIITYEINGEEKTIHNLKQVKPNRQTEENVYYIEVPKELEYAEHIVVSFTFREYIYQIVVK